MRFDQGGFRAAVRRGICAPPRVLAPLYRPSRKLLNHLHAQRSGPDAKRLRDHYKKLEERMPADALGTLRTATALAWRGANGYFPSYHFHVGEFLNDEWLSCVDWHKKFHRDHVSHQVMCYWVAKTILDAQVSDLTFGTHTLRQRCVQQAISAPECQYLRDYAEQMGAFANLDTQFRPLRWEQLFDEAVFLASMYHDIGYPWQFLQGIVGQLNDNAPLPCMPSQMGVRELYDAYGARLLCYPLQGYSTPTATQPPAWRHRSETLLMDGQIKTHGLPGALAFLYLNDILREYPAAAHQQSAGLFCLEWASLAILMHDLQKIYVGSAGANQPPENSQLRVSFRRDPLSFLITLVDQIQDFCRPNATFVPSGDKVRLSYPHACHAVDVTARPSGPMIITYCYQQRADYDKNTFEHKPKAQREYFDPNVGYVDWTGLPINSVRLLTRYEP